MSRLQDVWNKRQTHYQKRVAATNMALTDYNCFTWSTWHPKGHPPQKARNLRSSDWRAPFELRLRCQPWSIHTAPYHSTHQWQTEEFLAPGKATAPWPWMEALSRLQASSQMHTCEPDPSFEEIHRPCSEWQMTRYSHHCTCSHRTTGSIPRDHTFPRILQ